MSPLTRTDLPRMAEARRQVRPVVVALRRLYDTPVDGTLPLRALLDALSAGRAPLDDGPALQLREPLATTLGSVVHLLLPAAGDHGPTPPLEWQLRPEHSRVRLTLPGGASELAVGVSRHALLPLGGALTTRGNRLLLDLPASIFVGLPGE